MKPAANPSATPNAMKNKMSRIESLYINFFGHHFHLAVVLRNQT